MKQRPLFERMNAKTPDDLGNYGEKRIATHLGWARVFGKRGVILRNLYIPTWNNQTTEVDLLFITEKGIFVIESKDISGYIFGDMGNRYWTVTLYAGKDWIGRKHVKKYRLFNPIWQNRTHIKNLNRMLGPSIPLFSIVVFSDRCTLANITYDPQEATICQLSELRHSIDSIWKKNPSVLTEEKISEIYQRLFPLREKPGQRKKHVDQLKSRYESNESCPWCGNRLVVRTAKQGKNAGKKFYGCSNYPNCKYTKEWDGKEPTSDAKDISIEFEYVVINAEDD